MAQALRQADLIPREGRAAPAAPALPEEIVVSEPDPGHIAQLEDMGFSAAAARRALLLTHNQPNTAVNFLVQNMGSVHQEAEPTQAELRCASLMLISLGRVPWHFARPNDGSTVSQNVFMYHRRSRRPTSTCTTSTKRLGVLQTSVSRAQCSPGAAAAHRA